jgi:cytochrome c peroxidase
MSAVRALGLSWFTVALAALSPAPALSGIGDEVAIERHLADGEEFRLSAPALAAHGRKLFEAVWTSQEGGGRPLTKGTGSPLADPSDPLVFPRSFNRVSAPDANSCIGCHNTPRAGGGGDVVANVFVLGQRFDFATFDGLDAIPTKSSVDELRNRVALQTVANERNTLGMFGSGYVEMLARQMTEELIAIRDGIRPGGSAVLTTKGVVFGVLARRGDGSWDVSGVEGLPTTSLGSRGEAPSLVLRPFHQAGAVVSLREFTNNAFNHHHGIQSTERFGRGTDPDGDGFSDELTRADVTAASIFQATLPAPGRVIPRDKQIERAILRGEELFAEAGCASCHVPALPLDRRGWVFVEPNPYNPAGNLRPGEAPEVRLDLNDPRLPGPRLSVDAQSGVVWVPAFTDLKLHDITLGPGDPNREPLNMHAPAGSAEFFAGNARFLTRKLWGAANEPPYFHHGKLTTLRAAIEAHHGEAEGSQRAWQALREDDRAAVIEFLKSLRVLSPGAQSIVVDEAGRPRRWPPERP